MTPPGPDPRLAAVVLAGGTSRRLGGEDKAEVEVGGRRLLERVLDAVRALTDDVVVVGPTRAGLDGRGLRWTSEQPPGGGPAAGIATGVSCVDRPLVAVLAVDLPFVDAPALALLRDELLASPEADGALYVDDGGREQLLLGVWRTDRLRKALAGPVHGRSVRSVVAGLAVRRVTASDGAALLDCDTAEDLAAARSLVGTRRSTR